MPDAPGDPFERVAAKLKEASPAPPVSADTQAVAVAPVPPGAPAPTFKHPRHGEPSHSPWAYHNAAGEVLSYVVRFRGAEGKKEILPRTLWREPGGELRWRWKGAHGVRPLYRLPELSSRPAAPVLIVEGEKAADAAAARLPGFVTLTWSGGVAAVAKTDWAPLQGRRVVVWPDADAAGRGAGQVVLAELNKAGATHAAVVNLPPQLPEKWDLADPWPDGFGAAEASALAEAALDGARPTIEWPYGFRMESSGLWYDKPTDGKVVPTRLADPFEVIGQARDTDGGDWSVVIRFRDPDGRSKTQVISRGDLASSPGEVRAKLASEGLFINVQRGYAERFTSAMAEVKAANRLTLVNATGWAGSDRFVLPSETIGKRGCEPVLFTGNASALHYGAAGTAEGWRRDVAAYANGNPLLILALSIAFAGPLLRPLGLDGGGFHLRGPSSCGKTTLALAAGSVWGGGGPLGAANSWRATSNALEMISYGHSETVLVLDELALVAAEEAGQAAYSIASGQAKGRARQDGSLRARPEWRVMLLSTGEIGLADHIRTSRRGDRAMAGQELRLLDIAADGHPGQGVWEHLHSFATPADMSDAIKRACGQHYGHAGRAFVRHLVDDQHGAIDMAKQLMKSFLATVHRDGDTGQVHRGAHRFALVAAAGELAAAFGVVPWSELEASYAAQELFERWANAFGRGAVREEQSVLQTLRAAIEMHQARFATTAREDDDDGDEGGGRASEARALSTLGYRHAMGGEAFYLIHSAGWAEIFKGYDAPFAARTTEEAGFLLRGEGSHLMKVKRIGRETRRFYWVRSSLLEAA